MAVLVASVQAGGAGVAVRLVADVQDDVALLAGQRALDADPVVDGLGQGGGRALLAVPGGVVHLQDADQPVRLALADHGWRRRRRCSGPQRWPLPSTTRTVLAPSDLMSARACGVRSWVPGVRVVDAAHDERVAVGVEDPAAADGESGGGVRRLGRDGDRAEAGRPGRRAFGAGRLSRWSTSIDVGSAPTMDRWPSSYLLGSVLSTRRKPVEARCPPLRHGRYLFPALDKQMTTPTSSWERSHVHDRSMAHASVLAVLSRGIPVRSPQTPPSWSPPCRSSARRRSLHQVIHRPQPALAAARPTRTPGRTSGSTAAASCPASSSTATEQNLIYARTDIGGAYRWNQAGQQLDPAAGLGGPGPLGLQRRAQHRHRPGRHRTGSTPRSACTPTAGTRTTAPSCAPPTRAPPGRSPTLPFKVGGNMPGRGMGERLAVDPNNNSNVYFAAEGGNGLWRSTDFGATWAKVTAFPNAGNYVQDPADPNGYLSQNQGLTWVTFDDVDPRRSTSAWRTSRTRSTARTDGGTTWERIAGQPTGYLAAQGRGRHGRLPLHRHQRHRRPVRRRRRARCWRFDTATGTWTHISPTAGGRRLLRLLRPDRRPAEPDTLMVATQISWWPDAIFFRSTDGGATWTRIWDFDGYPSRSKRYTMDISANPWLDFNANPQPPEATPEARLDERVGGDRPVQLQPDALRHRRHHLRHHPADQLGRATPPFTIRPMAKGLEETAVLDLVSPPTGAPLVSALGDIGGFRHANLDAVPAELPRHPDLGSNTSLDFAELNPPVFVRVGNAERRAAHRRLHRRRRELVPGPGAGRASPAAAPSRSAPTPTAFVWSPAGAGVHYSTTRGSSWTASTGIPAGAEVESDRVNPRTFYGYAAGTFYVSTNGGATFTAHRRDRAGHGRRLRTPCPGRAGDVWLAGETGLLPLHRRRRHLHQGRRRDRGDQRRLRQGRAGRDLPGALPGRHGRRRGRACTAPTTPARPGSGSTTTPTSTATWATP